MQSSRPEASTSFATISFSRALSPAELKGMCTSLNFATRSARSGTTYGLEGDADFGVVAASDCASAAECWLAASGESVAMAMAAPASGSNKLRTRFLVIGSQFYRGGWVLENLEMVRAGQGTFKSIE